MRNGYRAPSPVGKAVIRKYRYPHPTSAPSGHLLPEEGGSDHASPFLGRGEGRSEAGLAFFTCGEAASSLPFPSGQCH